MLKLSLLLLTALVAGAADISILDSKTNPRISWVLVDDCAVPVPKSQLDNDCKIIKKVNEFCHLELDLEECDAKNK